MPEQFSPRKNLLQRYREVFREAWSRRERTGVARRYTAAEADFLPSSLAVSERPTPIMPHVALWAVCLLFIIAVLWSLIGRIDVVIVAQGKVLASGKSKAIQSVEPQVVRRILVREGQEVKEGDLLIEFDTTSAQADAKRYEAEFERAQALRWSFEVLLDNIDARNVDQALRMPNTPAPSDLALQNAMNRWAEHRAKMERALADLSRRRAERRVVDVTAEALRVRLQQQTRVEADYRRMAQEKAIAQHALAEQELKLLELQLEQRSNQAQAHQIDHAITEAEAAVALIHATDKASWRERLLETERDLSAAATEISKAVFRLSVNQLHAPTAGRVQQLGVFAPGAVVTSGQTIMTLVPLGEANEIEALVENRDIGFLRLGQRAEVKLEAFDYTRYGTLPAEVTVISADAVADERGNLRYPVLLRLERRTVRIGDREATVAPGMVTYADIKSGRRTIFSYFLSPILKTVQESLRER